jgi:hypothetical protein
MDEAGAPMDRLLLLLQTGKQIFPFYLYSLSCFLRRPVGRARHVNQGPTILRARPSEPCFSALRADLHCVHAEAAQATCRLIRFLPQQPAYSRYSLSIIQQPTRAAEFGTNVLSRLPLAPPLIVKLEVKDPKGNDVDM